MKDFNTFKEMLQQLLYILNKKQKRNALIMIVVIVIGSIWEMLGVSVILPFIQVLLNPEILKRNFFCGSIIEHLNLTTDKQIVFFVGLLIICVYVVKNAYLLISSLFQIKYKIGVQKDISVLILDSYVNQKYESIVNTNSGEILRGVSDDASDLATLIEVLFKFVAELMVVLSIGIYIFFTDIKIAVGIVGVCLICSCILILGLKKIMSRVGIEGRNASIQNNKIALEIVGGIKEIIVNGKRKEFITEYEKSWENRKKSMIKYFWGNACPERVIEAVCISGIICVVIIRFWIGIDVNEFVPKLAVLAVAAFRLLPSVSRIIGYCNSIVFFIPALQNAYLNVRNARERYEKRDVDAILQNDISFNNSVEFKNVTWKYKETDRLIFDGINLSIKKGQAIGIIGESGSGKSTLSDLFLGMYKPIKGEILCDGVNIFDNLPKWSSIVGYVPQTVYLIDDTIRANIAFGEQKIDETRITEVLKLVKLHDYVETLPDGKDTIVGERGVKLSGGQRQRIAIARALYKNPEILILDEATSALDTETEKAVMEAVELLQGQKTLFIIAHRLTTIKSCDAVYEVKDGKVTRVTISEK